MSAGLIISGAFLVGMVTGAGVWLSGWYFGRKSR